MLKRKNIHGYLPMNWYISLFIVVVIGICILLFQNFILKSSNIDSSLFFSKSFFVVIALLFISIPLAHIFIFFILRQIRKLIDFEDTEDMKIENLWSPSIIGILEILMFVIALLSKHEGFIGVWLVFKVASQWARWGNQYRDEKDSEKPKTLNDNRRRYMHFLMGNALVLIFSFIIYYIINFLLN